MGMSFSLKRFIAIVSISHLISYLCWAFIELSYIEPFRFIFNSEEARVAYLMVLFCVLFCGIPFYYVRKKENTKNF